MHYSPKNILISFKQPFRSLKHITFLIIPPHDVSESFPICFTFGLLNRAPSVILAFSPCFYSFYILRFLLTPLPTSFYNHVSSWDFLLCLPGPSVHPQLLLVASSKAPFRMFQSPSTEAHFLLLHLYLLIHELIPLFTLS